MDATVSRGKVIGIEYTLKLKGNKVVGTNVGKDPWTYTQGAEEMIRGVESAVEGMTVGEAKEVVVTPTDGYGQRDPDAFQEVPKANLPHDIEVGTRLHVRDQTGRIGPCTVATIKDDTVLLDFNHPLAGRTLFFDLKVVNIM